MKQHTRGDSFVRTFRIVNSNVTDWSTYTGRAQIRAYFEDGVLLSELDFRWLDTSQGIFSIQTNETQHWPQGIHVYDAEVSDGIRHFSSPVGKVDVVPDVTKIEVP